jgi:hypothetical protein
MADDFGRILGSGVPAGSFAAGGAFPFGTSLAGPAELFFWVLK